MNLITKSDIGKKFTLDGRSNDLVELVDIRTDGWVAIKDKAQNILIINPTRLAESSDAQILKAIIEEPKITVQPPYMKQIVKVQSKNICRN